MAIIIPSKHIYSKSFDPVVDNNLTRVEITAKKNNFVYTDEDVQSQDFDEFINISDKKISWNGDFNIITPYWYWTFAGLECNSINKINVLINIPVEQNQKYVKKIFYGKGENGDSNIKFQIYGDITTENITGNVSNLHKENSSDWNDNPTINITGITIKSKEEDVGFDLPSIVDYTYKYEENQDYKKVIKVELDCTSLGLTENEKTILTAEPKNIEIGGKKYISIQFSMLSSMNVIKWGSHYRQTSSSIPDTLDFDTAEKMTYLSKVLEVTVNGTIIKLNIEDESIKIGDGNKVYSFDGNELIQTKNTPSAENKYQGVIDEWKNGKQTAVISCSITDYYDENEKLKISQKKEVQLRLKCVEHQGDEWKFVSINADFEEGDSFFIHSYSGISYEVNITSQDANRGYVIIHYFNDFLAIDMIYDAYTITSIGHKPIPFLKEISMPFSFYIGDIVIPYAHTNKGDKPISYNKDFTPKQFKVVGTRISKKQGGTQELTLQAV